MTLLDVPRTGHDAGVRALMERIAKLEAQLAQVQAASAGAVAMLEQQAEIANQQALIESQTDFLAGQTQIDSRTTGVTASQTNMATMVDNLLAYSGTNDPSITLVAPSSGKLQVQASGSIALTAGGLSLTGRLKVEVLDSVGTQVRIFDGLVSDTADAPSGYTASATVYATGPSSQLTLTPGARYTIRLRRHWNAYPDTGTNTALVRWDFSTLVVTKLGM